MTMLQITSTNSIGTRLLRRKRKPLNKSFSSFYCGEYLREVVKPYMIHDIRRWEKLILDSHQELALVLDV